MSIAVETEEFFNTDEFAVEATIGTTAVKGIFDNAYAGALEYAAGTKPVFLCNSADLPAITLGTTTLAIGAATYTIVGREPDGHGLVSLVLEG